MAIWSIDHISDLFLTEKLGVIRSVTRKLRVLLSQADLNAAQARDYSALSLAMNAAPAPFSQLIDENTGQPKVGYESLVLVERSPKLIEDNATVDITLKYDHIMDGPYQSLAEPIQRGGVLFTKGRCSITEKTTNFYRKNGDPDEERVQILVGHTFPIWDTGAVVQCLDPELPNTAVQSGEISIPFPQGNIQLEGTTGNNVNPLIIARRFIAKINVAPWIGFPAFTWLCSEVGWEVLDTFNLIYRMRFEFQYNSDTWNPTVVFHDQRTGRAPAGVEAADFADPLSGNGVISYVRNSFTVDGLQPAGYWTVPALGQVNFDDLFQATFEGFEPPVMG